MSYQVKYRSGDFSGPVAIGAPRYEEPLLPDYNGILLVHQDYMQKLPVTAASLNTTYPGDGVTGADSTFYLVNEGPREDAGGYNVKWTRTWARIPNSHVKPGGVYYYAFPGLDSTGRPPTQPRPVWSQIQRDFYLVGTGGSYTDFAALVAGELIQAQQYNGGGDAYDIRSSSEIYLDSTTSPTETEWRALIAAGSTIVPEDSKIYQWQGNIFVRDTIYIPAQ